MKNTFLYLVGSSSSALLSFLLLPLYTRYLSPEDYGTIDVILAVVFILTPIFTFQASFACYRYLLDSRDARETGGIVSNSFFIIVIGNIVFVAGYLLLSAFVEIEYKYAILFFVLLGGVANYLQTLVRGLRENLFYTVIGVISTVTVLTANIVFIVGLHFKSISLLLAPICGNIAVIVIITVRMKLWQYFDFGLVSRQQIKFLLRYCVPLVPDAVCWWLLLGFGRVYLNYVDGADAVGILAVANKFPSMLTMFVSIFNLAWKETAILEYGSSDRDEYYGYIFNTQLVLMLSGFLAMLPAIRLIIEFLLGDSFKSAYQYVPLLIISAFFYTFSAFWGSGFESAKQTSGILYSTLYACVTNIILNLLLIPVLSVYGAVAANIAANAVLYYSRAAKSRQFFSVRVDKKRVVPLTVLVAVFGGLYYLPSMAVHALLMVAGTAVFIYYNLALVRKILVKATGLIRT